MRAHRSLPPVLALVGTLVSGCATLPVSEADTPPVLVFTPELQSPPEAARDGTEGTVEIECIITEKGVPKDCHIEHDLPGGLGEAVLEMVEQQRFRPAVKDGKPVAVSIIFPIWVRRPATAEASASHDASAPPASNVRNQPTKVRTHRIATPKIRMGMTRVSGRLPPEIIQRVVRYEFGRFRVCYERALSRNPRLEGRVDVRFVIGQSGGVVHASALDFGLPDPILIECVRRAFSDVVFPRPEGGPVVVIYPIMFSPGL